jgi:hypothetical protein
LHRPAEAGGIGRGQKKVEVIGHEHVRMHGQSPGAAQCGQIVPHAAKIGGIVEDWPPIDAALKYVVHATGDRKSGKSRHGTQAGVGRS